MKNLFKKIATLFAALVMVFGLASCDKSGNVKKAFEKEGYTITVLDSNNALIKDFVNSLDEDEKKDLEKYEFICATKNLVYVNVIVKFPSSKDLKNALTEEKDGKKDTSAYDKAKEEKLINGNCLLVLPDGGDGKNIFANA